MTQPNKPCSDCGDTAPVSRRDFIKVAAVTAALPTWAVASPSPSSPAETAAKALYESFTDTQRKEIAFDWDYVDPKRGLLRTHVSNNWQITKPTILGDFYTKKQQDLIHEVFKGLVNPEWYSKFLKQLKDDTGGKPWGAHQSIALFGKPGEKFQFVMTGRHMTIRADGNSEKSVAFGGPIFYGHAAQGFNEKPDHPGNVFWHQAQLANGVYKLLDDKQQAQALVNASPRESAVGFQGPKGKFPGLPIAGLTGDVKKELAKVLAALLEPYRIEDRDEATAALAAQGGLDACSLAFYKDADIGDDGVWDNWRIEGPSFVWYFRGDPHVHVWVNVADSPDVKLNARG